MSGSFENLIYDTGAYCTDLRQSTAPLQRMLDPTFANNCSSCRPADIGYIARQGVSITHQAPLIDVESDLKLLNYRNSRDPRQKYHPSCPNCVNGTPCGCEECRDKLYNFPACSISTDYSRVTNPPCNLRGTGVNRFQPLCLDPQDLNRWEHPGEVGINYRMIVKDNHVPCAPTPDDRNLVQPPPVPEEVVQCRNPTDLGCIFDAGSPFYHTYMQ